MHFCKIEFLGCVFLIEKHALPPPPPPSPPLLLAQVEALPRGLGLNLARRGGGEGRDLRVGTELCRNLSNMFLYEIAYLFLFGDDFGPPMHVGIC